MPLERLSIGTTDMIAEQGGNKDMLTISDNSCFVKLYWLKRKTASSVCETTVGGLEFTNEEGVNVCAMSEIKHMIIEL